MRYLFTILLMATLFSGALASQSFFYIAGAEGIFLASLNETDGQIGGLTQVSDIKEPGFLALSPDRRFLYVSYDQQVAAFKILADHHLERLNSKPCGGEGNCHVGVDAGGKNVYIANYGSGSIANFRIAPDGSIGDRTAFVQYTGSGPDKDRQTQPHAHSVYTDPQDRFLYSCDLGTDKVWIFRFDSSKGTLEPADPAFGQVPAGSGPRHLAFGDGGKFAYVVNEMGVSVTAFSRDAKSGSLTALQTVSSLLPGMSPHGGFSAEIFCHPSGKWLYASNRGSETISLFSIEHDGKLRLQQVEPCIVDWPRSFALDPKGHWIVVAGENGHRLAVLKIDPATGKLSDANQSVSVASPHCVLFISK